MPTVLKANGKKEEFDEIKLINSIKRAGIPEDIQEEVLTHIKESLYEGIPTHQVYSHIEEFLDKKGETSYKAKYSLKKALMELGPTGYPFEVYISEILRKMGYDITVGETLTGECVTHEVDIQAKKDKENIFIECKFHNRPGSRSDIQVALYTKARFDDLKEKNNFTKAMLITNTKISIDALSYCRCKQVDVLSWAYPEGRSLRDLIEKYKIYPITQLLSLNFVQKQELMNKNIVSVQLLLNDPKILDQINIHHDAKLKVIEEAKSF